MPPLGPEFAIHELLGSNGASRGSECELCLFYPSVEYRLSSHHASRCSPSAVSWHGLAMRRAPQELATSLSAWCIASLDAKRSVFCITYHAVPFHLSYLSAKPSTRAVGVVSVGIPREGWRRMYDVEAMEILAQGAEGKVYRTQFLGRPAIVKQRFKKVRCVHDSAPMRAMVRPP